MKSYTEYIHALYKSDPNYAFSVEEYLLEAIISDDKEVQSELQDFMQEEGFHL